MNKLSSPLAALALSMALAAASAPVASAQEFLDSGSEPQQQTAQETDPAQDDDAEYPSADGTSEGDPEDPSADTGFAELSDPDPELEPDPSSLAGDPDPSPLPDESGATPDEPAQTTLTAQTPEESVEAEPAAASDATDESQDAQAESIGNPEDPVDAETPSSPELPASDGPTAPAASQEAEPASDDVETNAQENQDNNAVSQEEDASDPSSEPSEQAATPAPEDEPSPQTESAASTEPKDESADALLDIDGESSPTVKDAATPGVEATPEAEPKDAQAESSPNEDLSPKAAESDAQKTSETDAGAKDAEVPADVEESKDVKASAGDGQKTSDTSTDTKGAKDPKTEGDTDAKADDAKAQKDTDAAESKAADDAEKTAADDAAESKDSDGADAKDPKATDADGKAKSKDAPKDALALEAPEAKGTSLLTAPPKEETLTTNASVSADGGTVTLTVKGGITTNAVNVAFKVTGPNGETWLQPKHEADGTWKLVVRASTFGEGSFTSTPVVAKTATELQELDGVDFKVPPTNAKAAFEYSEANAAFLLKASNVTCPDGVNGVAACLTTPNGDVMWYPLGKTGETSWQVIIYGDEIDWAQGTYRVGLWINDADWKAVDTGTTSIKIDFGQAEGYALPNEDMSQMVLTVQDGMAKIAWNVTFMLNDGSTNQWLPGVKQPDGSWDATVSTVGMGTQPYVCVPHIKLGNSVFTTDAYQVVIPDASGKGSVELVEAASKLHVQAEGVACPGGVMGVSACLTGPDGTTRWYALAKTGSGLWECDVDFLDFSHSVGTYYLGTWILDSTWSARQTDSTSATIKYTTEFSSKATVSADGSSVVLTASGGAAQDAAAKVSFMLTNGTATKWYSATKSAGKWTCTVTDELTGGSWLCVPHVSLGNSTLVMPSSNFKIPQASCDVDFVYDGVEDKVCISVSDIVCPTGLNGVSVSFSAPSGTTKWYTLTKQVDGTWAVDVPTKDFSWQSGTYVCDVYANDHNWTAQHLGSATKKITVTVEGMTAQTTDGGMVEVSMNGGRFTEAWNVAVRVDGSEGTTWVAAKKQVDGGWYASFPATQSGGGKLTLTGVANVGSSTLDLATTTVTAAESKTAKVTCTVNSSSDSITLSVAGGDTSKASNVAFTVLNTSDSGAKTNWYQAYKQVDGSWLAIIPAATDGVGVCAVEAFATVPGQPTVSLAEATYTYKVAPKIVATTVDLGTGDYTLSYGMAGLKVQRVQQKLGIGNYNYPRYLESTVSAVKAFQTKVGLPATGEVDHSTWLALGLTEYDWLHLGAYVSPVSVSPYATSGERIEAMIARAYDYMGDPYVWDAAGAPGVGTDCAGLVMQSLYAAGLDLGIINPITHSTTSWGDHDALNMFSYTEFTKVNASDRRRGDLVFYSTSGKVDHVAIYLGSDQIIEAYPTTVRVSSVNRGTIAGVSRVFA